MTLCIFTFTSVGEKLGEKISSLFVEAKCFRIKNGELTQRVKEAFFKFDFLLFVGSAGIAVRGISPFVKDKTSDPGVIVLDEKGKYIIPILSGHLGGANEFALSLAQLLGGQAILTTASDVNSIFAVDVFAKKNSLHISSMQKAKNFSALLLEKKSAEVFIPNAFASEIFFAEKIPSYISISDCKDFNENSAQVIISPQIKKDFEPFLQLIPKCLILGIGSKYGVKKEDFSFALKTFLQSQAIPLEAIRIISSISLKSEEEAIVDFCKENKIQFKTFSKEELQNVSGEFLESDFVKKITGVGNVCARSVMAAGAKRLLLDKTVVQHVTFALGILESKLYI